jgi:serine/threonine-protein kinase
MDLLSDYHAGAAGTPLYGIQGLRPGQNLGRYTLLVPVAQGGMAWVWAARQVGIRGFKKIVAIKAIMPALAADAEFERMFLDEARIAAAIHHPNVCEILDLGEVGNVLFLAMEWIDGVSLVELLKARPRMPLPDEIALRIMADACAGIHAAHELRDERGMPLSVVHRDVSPHNVLITTDGMIKVADFGVAKAMGVEHATTIAGQLKGKVAYMSPEQAVGDTNVDRRSDIFSLGAVLYEAVTGQRAWAGANDVARLQNLLAGNIIPPRQIRADLPSDLEAILGRALATEPNHRFQTAEQMRLAIEQFLVSRKQIVTATDIAATVRELCGRELGERQSLIRYAAAAMSEEARVPTTVGGLTVHRPATEGMRRSTATAISFIAGGVTIAGLLGIVAVGSLPPRLAGARAAAPPASEFVVAPQPHRRTNSIVVKPNPAAAMVEVNGVVLGSGERSFARPGRGETHTVVVRAEGFDPKTIYIDHDAPQSEYAVELLALADAQATSRKKMPLPTRTAKPPLRSAVPSPPRRVGLGPKSTEKPPAIPDNPF